MRKFAGIVILSLVLLGQRSEARLKTYPIIGKGDRQIGAQVAYASINSDNSEYLLLVNGLDAKASAFRLAPMLAYAYAQDRVLGCRFAIGSATGILDATSLSLLNDGLDFELSNLSASMSSKNLSLFHRRYIGLDPGGVVGLFYDFTLSYSRNRSELSSGTPSGNWTRTDKAGLSFSPGFVIFPNERVSTQVSVSVADVTYSSTDCYTDSQLSGTRTSFRAQARLDILALNFGLAVHF